MTMFLKLNFLASVKGVEIVMGLVEKLKGVLEITYYQADTYIGLYFHLFTRKIH